MADDKSKVGGRDRERVAGNQDYEIDFLAGKLGVSAEKVRQAIQAVGNDRAKVEVYLSSNKN
ncbi:DUF3606 domain-containing protein [Parapedobacter indicus]|uniref:DUF3606 domain-containing protein n=1 Tax=Parapedobacter indicus TaxID=1477437 RepID=A0A1I3CN19_9SPHI|nr:DUF3606 domain-containing protein [Parapedobacter indicus]PPL04320.1 uncharacterized protein DUF3606 [Parapedobacter indicus]SFH75887.1 Protein of unknown function [Parapedobacter indicus]